MIVVYKILNKETNDFYIGSTINWTRRKKGHVKALNRDKHKNSYLQNAWNKYGKVSFDFHIVETCNTNNILQREQHYINKLNPTYNILKNVGFTWTGAKHSLKTRIKMKNSKLGNKNPAKGSGRKIIQLNLDGILVREYNSTLDAAKALNLGYRIVHKKNRYRPRKVYRTKNLKRCLKGNRPTAHGYKWEYKNNNN